LAEGNLELKPTVASVSAPADATLEVAIERSAAAEAGLRYSEDEISVPDDADNRCTAQACDCAGRTYPDDG
jgi:hypothetical protein